MKIHLLKISILSLCIILLSSCQFSGDKSTTIRLAYLQSDLHHLPAFVALEKGFYQQEGISVEVSGIFKAGPEMMSGFSAGSIDAGYVGLAPVVVAVANKTAQLQILAQVNKNGSALVIKKAAPFTQLAELQGKGNCHPRSCNYTGLSPAQGPFRCGNFRNRYNGDHH